MPRSGVVGGCLPCQAGRHFVRLNDILVRGLGWHYVLRTRVRVGDTNAGSRRKVLLVDFPHGVWHKYLSRPACPLLFPTNTLLFQGGPRRTIKANNMVIPHYCPQQPGKRAPLGFRLERLERLCPLCKLLKGHYIIIVPN